MSNRRAQRYDEYMIIVRQAGGHYELRRIRSSCVPIKALTIRGHRYIIRKEKAFVLKGWYPWTKIRFFQSIVDYIAHRATWIGLLLYEEPKERTDEYIEPLDRIDDGVTKPSPIDVLTPYMHRVIGDSKVFADRMRKLHFGTGVSVKFIVLMLAIIVILIIVLNLGGFFE